MDNEPALLIPGLAPFYRGVAPLSWVVVRCTVGAMLAVHGWPKLFHFGGVVTNMVQHGFNPAMPAALAVTIIEFVGGICIVLGLFTRFFAAAAAIELAVLTFVIFGPNGFGWAHQGYEYMLVWGLILFAVALHGGGAYSLDRAIGREL